MARRILFVCLGNICRSPTAEGVLGNLIAKEARGLEVLIDSAGTADYHIGVPPDMRSQRAALRRGIDLSGLRARQIAPQDFADFDLILAMDRNNLRDLRSLQPRGSRATLRLFMEYAEVAGRVAGDAGDGLDVPDPYYGDASAFELVLDLCATASRGLIAALQKRA